MAEVYRVRHARLGSLHALKLVHADSPGVQERLMREGRAQAGLHHPNVVSVTDVVNINGQAGLIMEFVDGPSLDHLLAAHRLTLAQAMGLAQGIIRGVGAAHRQGFVHRDLKPANVLLQPTDTGFSPKVADFGLVKALTLGTSTAPGQTRTGTVMGTPSFMAPEQIRDAKNVDQRADIFSLGALLYEMFCGQRAFEGEHLGEVFVSISNGSFTNPREHVEDLPLSVLQAIVGALTVDRDERIPTCERLLATLQGLADVPEETGQVGEWPVSLMQQFSSHSSGVALPSNSTLAGPADPSSEEAGMQHSSETFHFDSLHAPLPSSELPPGQDATFELEPDQEELEPSTARARPERAGHFEDSSSTKASVAVLANQPGSGGGSGAHHGSQLPVHASLARAVRASD